MLKKTLQTLFIFAALTAFAQQKDRLGVPGPLKLETADATVEYKLTKSSVNPKTRVITQEYQPKSPAGDRVMVSFHPGQEAVQIWELKAEEIKGSDDKKISEIDMNSDDEGFHSIKYLYTTDKKAERREILIGNVNAVDAKSKGSFVIEYFGGNPDKESVVTKLPEMIQIKPEY